MMETKIKYYNKRKLNFISVFLVIDILLIFGMLKTSSATYVSRAIGDAPLKVALFAIDATKLADVNSNSNTVDIKISDIAPGEVKTFRFDVTNAMKKGNEKGISDVNTIYDLKIITTANVQFIYKLYLNQNPANSNAVDLLHNGTTDLGIVTTDDYGTQFKYYTIDTKCMKKAIETIDTYYLSIEFPNIYSSYQYQDLIDSIKIQIDTKQVVSDDNITIRNLCA